MQPLQSLEWGSALDLSHAVILNAEHVITVIIHTDLHRLSFCMQVALRNEPDRRQALEGPRHVASSGFITAWNRDKTSESVVLFLRALAASHMLQNQQFYDERCQMVWPPSG